MLNFHPIFAAVFLHQKSSGEKTLRSLKHYFGGIRKKKKVILLQMIYVCLACMNVPLLYRK